MVTICVIPKDTRYPLSKHDFWKMPFDKKISTKHRTLKCHFTPLTSSGTGGKRPAGSKASHRIQWTVPVDSPGRELLTSVYVFQLWLFCDKYHAFSKTYWGTNEFSGYDFSSFSSCWMLSDVQGTPLSVLYSIFIDVQNSLFTIRKRNLHSKTFSYLYLQRRFCFVLFLSAKTWICVLAHPFQHVS